LYGHDDEQGTLLTIKYPDAGAYKVYDEKKELAIPTDWDYTEETWALPTGKYCGENRYQGHLTRLQFWIDPGCTLYVVPRDAIMLAVRLEWTVKEFYQESSIGQFTDRMAAALNIHRGDMKVVQVYEGSVILEFMVMSEGEPSEESKKELEAVSDKFQRVAPALSDSRALGAPIISFATAKGDTVFMEDYKKADEEEPMNMGVLILSFMLFICIVLIIILIILMLRK